MTVEHPARRNFAAIALVWGLALGSATAQAQRVHGSFQRTLSVSGGAEVDIVSGSGSIEVRQGGSGRLEVSARIQAEDGRGWRRRTLTAEERVRRLEDFSREAEQICESPSQS